MREVIKYADHLWLDTVISIMRVKGNSEVRCAMCIQVL